MELFIYILHLLGFLWFQHVCLIYWSNTKKIDKASLSSLISSSLLFLTYFSYVRDATAAMAVAFSLFVFPSTRPRIFAPDGSGKQCLDQNERYSEYTHCVKIFRQQITFLKSLILRLDNKGQKVGPLRKVYIGTDYTIIRLKICIQGRS